MAAAGLKLYMSKRGDALKRLHLKMSKVERERGREESTVTRGNVVGRVWMCAPCQCWCACKRVCRCTSPHQEVYEAYGPQTFKFKAEAITHDPKVSCVIVRA